MRFNRFILITLFIPLCLACPNKQRITQGTPEDGTFPEQETLPELPPINERLQGTVWITSDMMWEDIPIGEITSIYVFNAGEVRLQNIDTFSEEIDSEHLNRTVPYTVLEPNLITFDTYNHHVISFVDEEGESYPVVTSYYPDDYDLILEGKMKPGTIIRSRRLYPSAMEFIDRDYTKTLTLEGTRWKWYAMQRSSDDEIIYSLSDSGYPNDLIVNQVYDDNSNILYFDNGMCTTGPRKTFVRYTITPKSIILEPSPHAESKTPNILIIKDNRLIVATPGYAPVGYIKIYP